MAVGKRGLNSKFPRWGLKELHSCVTALLIEVSVVIRFYFKSMIKALKNSFGALFTKTLTAQMVTDCPLFQEQVVLYQDRWWCDSLSPAVLFSTEDLCTNC